MDKTSDDKSTKKKRVSAQLREAATRVGVGGNMLPRIERIAGRSGDGISLATLKRWERDGFVVIHYRDPKRTEHHRAKPIARVELTADGAAAVKGKAA